MLDNTETTEMTEYLFLKRNAEWFNGDTSEGASCVYDCGWYSLLGEAPIAHFVRLVALWDDVREDVVHAGFAKMPANLMSYLEKDTLFSALVYADLCESGEYWPAVFNKLPTCRKEVEEIVRNVMAKITPNPKDEPGTPD